MTRGTAWALDVLMDLGITYDASLFPASRGHEGYTCVPGPHALRTPSGRALSELPMSIARFGLGPLSKRLCYCGGGYLRLLPLGMIRRGVEQEARAGRPTVVYLHPRDLAPDMPRVPIPPRRRFLCYVGLSGMEGKLGAVPKRYRWGPCAVVLARAGLGEAAALARR